MQSLWIDLFCPYADQRSSSREEIRDLQVGIEPTSRSRRTQHFHYAIGRLINLPLRHLKL